MNALDLLVHSPNIVVSDFEVHDGLECSCGKSYCGPIAGSDHAFVTATLDILRPVERLLERRWTWNQTTDWNAAMKRFAPHFTLLATWITTISTTVACEDRNQSQALIGRLCYVWCAIQWAPSQIVADGIHRTTDRRSNLGGTRNVMKLQ